MHTNSRILPWYCMDVTLAFHSYFLIGCERWTFDLIFTTIIWQAHTVLKWYYVWLRNNECCQENIYMWFCFCHIPHSFLYTRIVKSCIIVHESLFVCVLRPIESQGHFKPDSTNGLMVVSSRHEEAQRQGQERMDNYITQLIHSKFRTRWKDGK